MSEGVLKAAQGPGGGLSSRYCERRRRFDKYSEVWYKCATLGRGHGSEEPDEKMMNLLALDTVLIALVIILLVELLGLGERLAVGRVPA